MAPVTHERAKCYLETATSTLSRAKKGGVKPEEGFVVLQRDRVDPSELRVAMLVDCVQKYRYEKKMAREWKWAGVHSKGGRLGGAKQKRTNADHLIRKGKSPHYQDEEHLGGPNRTAQSDGRGMLRHSGQLCSNASGHIGRVLEGKGSKGLTNRRDPRRVRVQPPEASPGPHRRRATGGR